MSIEDQLTAQDWAELEAVVIDPRNFRFGYQLPPPPKSLALFHQMGYVTLEDDGPGGMYEVYRATPRGKRALEGYKARQG